MAKTTRKSPRLTSRKFLSSTNYDRLEDKNLLASIQIIGAGTTNDEVIELQIDGTTVQSFNGLGSGAYQGNFVTLTHSTTEAITADQIRIAFTNDLYDPANGVDRNVRIDAILIDGVRFETEDTSVFSTGTWKPEDGIVPGFRESEFLHSDGYFEYSVPGTSGTKIDVVARGEEAEERFEVRVDGSTVASFQVTSDFQTYSFVSNREVSVDQVQVVFTNDLWAPVDGIDRNLIVDYIVIDGQRYDSEAPTVFSTGTWLAEDGIEPGFRLSETLHTNGYFQYGQAVNPGTIQLETSVINLAESDSTAQFTILRNGGSDGIITVDYRTVALTATAGEDFVAREGTVTFQDGQTSSTVVVSLLEDSLIESDEQFSFAIDNVVGGATLLAPRTATVTIDDNDSIRAEGDGLLGEYFNARGFTQRFQNRVDATIDFDWRSGAPISGMGSDSFSIRWTGEIEPRFNETYTFTTRTDDGVRLWVNDQLIIDQFVDQAATEHSGTISLVGGQLYDIRMEYYENGGEAVAQLLWSSNSQTLEVVPTSQLYAADPPPPTPGGELVTQDLVTNLVQPTAIDFSPDGERMYIAEQRGVIRVVENGNLISTPFLDFRDRVNGTRDRGLLDIAVHPDFENNPYIYLIYTYDPPEVNSHATGTLQGPDGKGNRAGRMTRVTADAATGYRTLVPNSEVVLIGKNSTWDNFNGFVNSTVDFNEPPAGILSDGTNLNDFIATDSESHTVGSVEFGPDGALYVSIGDGTSYNRVDPRTVRVQDIDNLSGKILRVDPITGQGLEGNPFYNGDTDANRSKVYHYGLRNPFRITAQPDTGNIFVGDVGWTQWEEVNAGAPGSNFGWPYYEGANGTNSRTGGYQDLPEAQDFYNSGQVATPSTYALNHAASGINAIVLGDFYTGDTYPEEYQGDLFFNDLGQGIVRNISFDASGNITDVSTFTTDAEVVVQMVQGPDGNLYFVDLDNGTVGRWVFQEQGSSQIAAVPAEGAPVSGVDNVADANGVTVALIDSGIDLSHTALAGNIWTNPAEIAGDGIDNDGNGLIDDVHGYNFTNESGTLQDLIGHGTFTAGLIAGQNTTGFSGFAPGTEIMSLQVVSAEGSGAADDVARAIRYAVDQGADVISLPLDVTESEAVLSAVQHAAENDILIVVAAGNEGQAIPSWLAGLSGRFENVVSAGAISHDGTLLSESNRVGNSMAVQIDATGIAFSTLPGEQYGTYRGTSVSTAVVTSAAALAKSTNPLLTAAQLRELLVATTSIVASGSDSHGTLDIPAVVVLAEQTLQVELERDGDRLYVRTSSQDDEVVYHMNESTLSINGINYSIPDIAGVQRLIVNGNQGSDRLSVVGSEANEKGLIRTGYARLLSSNLVLVAHDFDFVTFYAGGGNDSLQLIDTSGDDVLLVNPLESSLTANGIYRGGFGFSNIRAVSNSGEDQAYYWGTDGPDRFYGTPNIARILNANFIAQSTGFRSVDVELGNGFDPVILRGDQGAQSLTISPGVAEYSGENFLIQLKGLERTTSNSFGGLDTLRMDDGEGRDVVNSRPSNTLLVGVGYDHRAYNYETTTIRSSGGNDRATLVGSDGDDTFFGSPGFSQLKRIGWETNLLNFPTVLVFGRGGNDMTDLQGSNGDETLFQSSAMTNFVGDGFSLTTRQFETTRVDGKQGNDRAALLEGNGNSTLKLQADQVDLSTPLYSTLLTNVEEVRAVSEIDADDDKIEIVDEVLNYVFRELGDWDYL